MRCDIGDRVAAKINGDFVCGTVVSIYTDAFPFFSGRYCFNYKIVVPPHNHKFTIPEYDIWDIYKVGDVRFKRINSERSHNMKKVVLEKVNKTITFNDFIEKGVTDKEALKWLHSKYGNSTAFSKLFILEMLDCEDKPTCWIDWVNKNFPDYTDENIVYIGDVSEAKIYAWKGTTSVYKIHDLHWGSSTRFASMSCINSASIANGTSNTLKEMIDLCIREGHIVYEFFSQKEFFEWASMVTCTEEVK